MLAKFVRSFDLWDYHNIIYIVYQVQSANLIVVKNTCEICWFIWFIDKIVTIILNDGSCMKKNAHTCCCYKLLFFFFLEKSVAVTSFMVCTVQTLKVSISNEPPCCVCVFFLEREEVCEYFNNLCIIWRKRVVSIIVMRKEKGDKDIPSLRSWTGWGCDAM